MKPIFTIFFQLILVCVSQAQFGNYQSLNLPMGARNAALGGRVNSLADGDLMQVNHNPATLDSVSVGALGMNYTPVFSGIYFFNTAYVAGFDKIGKLAISVNYLNYGSFEETSPNGDELGEFNAYDYAIAVSKAHKLNNFSLGGSVRFAQSSLAGTGSSLILMDLGGLYRSPKQDFTTALVFKNFGFVISEFSGAVQNTVPFDVQISISFKPEFMPFRFSLSAFNLTETDLYFESEENAQSRTVEIADRIFRRINIGTELILHKKVQVLVGYSHLRRQELRLTSGAYGAGFSFGLALEIKQFHIQYAHTSYHAAGGSDFFTITTNLNAFKKIL